MPEAYDRGRKPAEGMLDMWLDRIAAALAGRDIATIIDLGCGTGRFSGALAQRFAAEVIGVDPSQKMLAQATAKAIPGVRFVRGAGERIPCGDASVDLIFASMAFHHFAAPHEVARECRRALRPAGAVCIRNSLREHGSPYEAYFPNYRAALEILPSANEIAGAFAAAGFALLTHEVIAHVMATSLADLAEKAAFRADTTLVRLSDDDFNRGLANLRAADRVAGAGPATIDVSLFVFAQGPESLAADTSPVS
jgi:ubiquinone/menaquinone biosynthesis C-methylase UbiE